MKNIHILPTDKPSRLRYFNGKLELMYLVPKKSDIVFQNIYLTSDKEIKEGDWYENNGVIFKADDVFDEGNNPNNSNPRVTDFNNKIILTTDKDLIKDGVQAIDDEFLEWFVKNPSCEEVDVDKNWNYPLDKSWEYKIIIPNEEPKQETPESIIQDIATHLSKTVPETLQHIEEFSKELDKLKSKQETLEKAAHKMLMDFGIMSVGESINVLNVKKLMVLFAKEQQDKNKYSEEYVIALLESLVEHPTKPGYKRRDILKVIEQFKKK